MANSLQEDDDADNIGNACDNCLLVANASQRDSNNDGYGNRCDADINNNGVINFVDLGILKNAFLSSPGDTHWNAHADFDCNSVVNFIDIGVLKLDFLGEPGPSAFVP